MQGAKSATFLISTFNLALSVEAFEQFLVLEQVVHNFQPINAAIDGPTFGENQNSLGAKLTDTFEIPSLVLAN